MPKFPGPPGALTVAADIKALPAGTRLWRVYFAGGAHAATWNGFRFFGPPNAGFDHHDDPQRLQAKGILYASLSPATCLAEVFQAARVIDRGARQPWLVGFELLTELKLLDLSGGWPTRAGASMAINTGPRPRARGWSRLIYGTYASIAGLYYPSSMNANKPSVALYERAQGVMPAVPVFNRALSDRALTRRLATAAMRLGYGLV